MIRISKRYPLPTRHKTTKYPWTLMKVGDSFFVKGRFRDNLNSSRDWAQKHTGFTFVMRQTTQGVRIWRSK